VATEEELKKARLAHAEKLRESGTQPWPNRFRATDETEQSRRDVVELASDTEDSRNALPLEDDLPEDAERYWLYGRVVAKRGPFLVIRTPYGDAQALVRPESLAEPGPSHLAAVDLADHVLVRGALIRTKTGALAVRADEYQHLSKAVLPPPAKWHGLKDVEKRYRERYVDLFANPEVAKTFRARSRIVQALRAFLDERGFLEVETPLLHMVRGGATAKPFETHHNTLDLDLYLRIAPELYLKRLLVGGYDRVYEIGRNFRNEGISTRHNPEFTMLELYAAYATYEDLMDLTVEMFRTVDGAVLEAYPELGKDRTWTLDEDFARVTMRRAILDRLDRAGKDGVPETPWAERVDEAALSDPDELAAAVEAMLPRVDDVTRKQLAGCEHHGERVFMLYELLSEPHLPALYRSADGALSVPVFITEYPLVVSPLARKNDESPEWVDRFEIFVEGREMANAFSELNDPIDQAERFAEQVACRAKGDEEAMDYDADYIRALSHGMPPAAGFGLGVDRLCMLLAGQPSIRDVLLFPLLRPEVG